MILTFRNKALEKIYEGGSGRGLPAEFLPKIKRVLIALDVAQSPDDLSQPGFGLHPLSGNLKGFWSILVSRNWRTIFRFSGQDICDVDFVDYH